MKIPDRFEKEILIHIVNNFACNLEIPIKKQVPLILGVHGRSGQGKTYQIEETLKKHNIKLFRISGSELENERAGEPAKIIKEKYIEASKVDIQNCNGSVLIIDDVDAGMGTWGDMYQYTVNTQIVIATLMHLADNPEQIEGKLTMRIPIILTGNDFTKIYEPISRPGRMKAFHWEPNFNEKVEIVNELFQFLNLDEVTQVVERFNDKPVAFFSILNSYVLEYALWNHIGSFGVQNTIDNIKKGKVPSFYTDGSYYTLDDLIQAGEKIVKNSTYINHLINKENGNNFN